MLYNSVADEEAQGCKEANKTSSPIACVNQSSKPCSNLGVYKVPGSSYAARFKAPYLPHGASNQIAQAHRLSTLAGLLLERSLFFAFLESSSPSSSSCSHGVTVRKRFKRLLLAVSVSVAQGGGVGGETRSARDQLAFPLLLVLLVLVLVGVREGGVHILHSSCMRKQHRANHLHTGHLIWRHRHDSSWGSGHPDSQRTRRARKGACGHAVHPSSLTGHPRPPATSSCNHQNAHTFTEHAH
jgi:hypothetical protein